MTTSPQRTLYYTRNLNPRVAVAVAKHLASPLDYVRFEPMGVDQEMCRPINPNTLAPVLVEGDHSLWETDAIALRLSRLAGGDFWPDEHAVEMMMWVSWSAHHFTLAGGTYYFEHLVAPAFLPGSPNLDLLAATEGDFLRFAKVLDDTLAQRDWLVGGKLSYADFRVASALPFAEAAHMPVGEFRYILAWHGRLNQLDAWRDPFAGLA